MGQHHTCNMKGIEGAELQAMYKKFVVECPSGGLHLHEFKQFFGITDQSEASEYAESAFKSFDRNGDNMIDFLEYVAVLNLVLRGKPEHKLKWSFKVYDTDGNGFLDKAELRKMVMSIYNIKQGWTRSTDAQMSNLEAVCDRIFQLMDENHDGKISLKEFVDGIQRDDWIRKTLHIDINPTEWILKQQEKRNAGVKY
ncbi:Guanylyl cyclase-activating protein 2 [Varanus komodoensis]|uniref:Guanylyl cyclase-activating protein 2 n=1 Tax=Varanus komodoensis TaxID=61221 RepID=A0A8D2L5R5_VARKO|nr:guanylyl cyclase-activating protein 2-like [Varanus komodoensis]KAF7252046.1 Guanylyl cyclase-activating protein 2 [Varanus komodoensis]